MDVEDFFATAYFLCPDFIEVNGCIVLSDILGRTDEQIIDYVNAELLEKKDRKMVERWINCTGIIEFFPTSNSGMLEFEETFLKICDLIEYFWGNRLKTLYPSKDFCFERGNELCGELGMAITFYQV